MRVDIPVGFIFLIKVRQNLRLNIVLQHIGMVACVKSVAVAQHNNLFSLKFLKTLNLESQSIPMYLIHHLVHSSETYTSSKTQTLNYGEKHH
jgi:hypothetical protein